MSDMDGLSRASADTRAVGNSIVRTTTVAGGVLAVAAVGGLVYGLSPHPSAAAVLPVVTREQLQDQDGFGFQDPGGFQGQAGPGSGQGPVASSGGS